MTEIEIEGIFQFIVACFVVSMFCLGFVHFITWIFTGATGFSWCLGVC